MIFDVSGAEEKLGYVFNEKMLLRKAFTHSSYSNENPGSESNETLEFFGDSILGFVVKEYLYKRFPEKHEGELTEICQRILSTEPLASAVLRKKLNDCLLLGVGELKNKDNHSICEDLFEACVAAIYLDGGIIPVKKFILNSLKREIDSSLNLPEKTKSDNAPKQKKASYPNISEKSKKKINVEQREKDAKSILSEAMQKQGRNHEYILEEKSGPDHAPIFSVQLKIDGKKISHGTGKNKKSAEQQAAKIALEKLKL